MWKIVWNAEQSNAPVSYPYSPDQPTIVLFESPTRDTTDGLSFQVLGVPPGTYAVAFYEVDENYQHYRWDQFTVRGALRRPVVTTLWIGGLAFALGLFVVLTRRTHSRHKTP